jgi:hypothetical protein
VLPSFSNLILVAGRSIARDFSRLEDDSSWFLLDFQADAPVQESAVPATAGFAIKVPVEAIDMTSRSACLRILFALLLLCSVSPSADYFWRDSGLVVGGLDKV